MTRSIKKLLPKSILMQTNCNWWWKKAIIGRDSESVGELLK
jgi:hypothetical protein